jgi:hypothetical protein
MAAIVIALLLTGSGNLNAQTAADQQTVEVKLALSRLGQGSRIAESIQTLMMTALEEPVRKVRRAGAALHRLVDRQLMQAGGPMRGKRKPR